MTLTLDTKQKLGLHASMAVVVLLFLCNLFAIIYISTKYLIGMRVKSSMVILFYVVATIETCFYLVNIYFTW